MKYYHIIYNSSEKPMNGGVGFGIRTATEGTPDGLLNAIKDVKFFTDDWETYKDKPTPAQMKENPASIESVAKNYAVTSITDDQGKVYYMIARRAYVGFDYGFYKNGKPTRPGNYVIDYYIFDSTPESSAYEILYEKAKAESNHFIPKSVQPTEDNEEMKEISLGAQSPLAITEKPFTADIENALDKDVVKLFFTYLQSKQRGKKLVLKTDEEKALRLTADLYRMLDTESAKSVRTYINLRSEGINENFDIFFIYEDYPHQIYSGLYDYVEFDTAPMPDTDEAHTFAEDLENWVLSSFQDNKADIDDILKWLLMPEYNTVKLLSKQTNDAFFRYCIQPDNFVYNNFKDDKGNLNDEFLKVLCPYTKKNSGNANRFNLLVTETMLEATPESLLGLVQDYNHFQNLGFNLEEITEEVKQNVCTQLLSDVKLFKMILDTLTLEGIQKFFVKSLFEEKKEYLGTGILDYKILDIYKLFLTDRDMEEKDSVLYERFMKRDMPQEIFKNLVDEFYGCDTDLKINFFCNVLLNGYKPFKTVWPYIEHYLHNSNNTYDFLKIFESKLEDRDYAPMFYYSICKNKRAFTTAAAMPKLTDILAKNAALKALVENNYEKDGLYEGYYQELKNSCKENPEMTLESVLQNVVNFLKVRDMKFIILTHYLDIVINGNTQKAEYLNDDEIKLLYDEINNQENAKVFQDLLPKFVAIAKSGKIQPCDLAKRYRCYNSQAHTIDMLYDLVPENDKGWIDMISVVIKEVNHKSFNEAFDLAHKFGMNAGSMEKLFIKAYEKDYKAYKFKNKIKRFFKAIAKIFTKKEDGTKQKKDANKPAANKKGNNKTSQQKDA